MEYKAFLPIISFHFIMFSVELPLFLTSGVDTDNSAHALVSFPKTLISAYIQVYFN